MSLKSRAVAFSTCAGTVVFILAMVVGGSTFHEPSEIGSALILAILCAAMSWASTQRVVAGIAESVDGATERLIAAAHGDLSSDVPVAIRRDLPDLSIAMDSLFSQVRTTLENIHSLAMFDPVTGLANRTSFCRQVELQLAERHPATLSALYFIDLDGFKSVNDSLGHAAGDQLLARIGGRLRELVMTQVAAGMGDIVLGRLAGDEFTLFCVALPDREGARRVARAIQFAFGEPVDIGGQQVSIAASVGVAFFPDHGNNLPNLMRSADIAMYHAKANGRGRTEFYTAALADSMAGREELERDLRIAVERDEFLLQFQPQMDVTTGRVVAAEALLRWDHPERGLILPPTFMPLAEESGVIVQLGDWVMDRVCAVAGHWRARGMAQRVALNVSARELTQPDFMLRLRAAMERHDVPADRIELEIGETLLMAMEDRTLDQLRALRRDGVTVAMGDFGTGYSNLSRLRELPVDRVKIDRTLVHDVALSQDARIICGAMIGLIQGLGLEVVAQGIEYSDQIDILRALGCTIFQGYHLAPPVAERDYLERFSGGQGLKLAS